MTAATHLTGSATGLAGGRRLRVALVGEYPVNEDGIQEGGLQSVTYALAHALARRADVECHVVAAMSGASVAYRQVGALHVHYMKRLPLPRLVTMRMHDMPGLVRLVRSLQPDIVHGQGQDRHGLAALNSGLPAVITPHGVLFIESRLHRRHAGDIIGACKQHLITSMEREVFRRARDMIIISRYLPEIYGPMLQARQHHIENPISQQFFDVQRAPEPGRLLFVGTVVRRKCVHDLVAAVAAVLGRTDGASAAAAPWRKGLQLRIAGPLLDPEAVAMVRRAIESHGLQERVTLLGPISQAALFEELRRAQIMVMASREETTPQVIAQAMACGLPVVASAVGGIPAMVQPAESALLFPFSDTNACAAQIRRLLDDAPLRLAMEARNLAQARARFHPDAVAAQTTAVYRGILAQG